MAKTTKDLGVMSESVIFYSTRKPGVLGSSRTGRAGFFVSVSLGRTLQSPSLVPVKPRKDMNNVSLRRDTTEILLKKTALNTIQSINKRPRKLYKHTVQPSKQSRHKSIKED